MATLFRATGGTVGSLVPTTSWASPNGMFPTTARNDGTAYSWSSSTSTVTLPSSGLADAYLIRATLEFESTNNGRQMIAGRFSHASGTGDFVTAHGSGYNRDDSEDRAWVHTVALIRNPSASATIAFQWKRDSDAPTATDGIVNSAFEVIPIYGSEFGMYTSTTAALLGGTTYTAADISTTVHEGASNINRSSNVVTVSGDNKRYLVIGSLYGEAYGNIRTQRQVALGIDGSQDNSRAGYYYSRQNGTALGGTFVWDIIETATSDVTIEIEARRGAGTSNLDGGADADGSTPSNTANALIVVELNDSAEVWRSHDATLGQNVATTGPIDLNAARTADFNDTASYTQSSVSAVNIVQSHDALVGGSVYSASNDVTTQLRFSAESHITLNGTEQETTNAGSYTRNRDGGSGTWTFGGGYQPGGFLAVSTNDTIGLSVTELSGSEGGAGAQQPIGVGLWVINLDTLEGTTDATATGTIAYPIATVTGTGTQTHTATGAISAPMAVVAGTGNMVPSGTGAIAAPMAVVAGTGAQTQTATGATTYPIALVAGTGTQTQTATGAISYPIALVSGTGTHPFTATGTISYPIAGVAGTGSHSQTATGAITYPTITVSGTGIHGAFSGTGAITYPIAVVSGTGAVPSTATGAIAYPMATVQGFGTLAGYVYGPPSADPTYTTTVPAASPTLTSGVPASEPSLSTGVPSAEPTLAFGVPDSDNQYIYGS